MAADRFASLNKSEFQELFDNVDSDNTKKSTDTAVKAFREYLTAKNISADFENLSAAELDEKLSTFYCEMRNQKGEMYRKGTLIAYRHGLQRYLEKAGKGFDIIKGAEFKLSMKAFKCMTKEMKRQGLGNVVHYPSITDQDLETIYLYLTSDREDTQRLQYKVFLDIMLHFGRRGRENLATLTRDDFAVTKNGNGTLYVYKATDEKTKNHQDDNQKASDGRMYEIKDSNRCPVRSFVKLIKRLNPKCDRLFQKARLLPKDGVYFDNVPLGHNKLGSFISEISKKAGLRIIYTNHSCRVTIVHVLDAAQIPSRHIMTVTGHKSESSLKTYSGITDENTKQIMSEKISERIRGKYENEAKNGNSLDDTSPNFNLLPLTNSQEDSLMEDLLNNNDGVDELLRSIEKPQMTDSSNVHLNIENTNLNQFSMLVFYNCSNITFNYNVLLKQ